MTVYQWAMVVIGICATFIIPAAVQWWRVGSRVTGVEDRVARLEDDMKSRPDKSDIVKLEGAINTQTQAIDGIKNEMRAHGAQIGRIHDYLIHNSGGK